MVKCTTSKNLSGFRRGATGLTVAGRKPRFANPEAAPIRVLVAVESHQMRLSLARRLCAGGLKAEAANAGIMVRDNGLLNRLDRYAPHVLLLDDLRGDNGFSDNISYLNSHYNGGHNLLRILLVRDTPAPPAEFDWGVGILDLSALRRQDALAAAVRQAALPILERRAKLKAERPLVKPKRLSAVEAFLQKL